MSKLTRKQKAFADKILDNPLITGKQAAKEVFGTGKEISDGTAEVIASEYLRKPQIMAYLDTYSTKAEHVVVEAMKAKKNQYGFNPDTKGMELIASEPDHAIRLRAADSLMDRLHGKATQRVETTSKTISIAIDLTQMDAGEAA